MNRLWKGVPRSLEVLSSLLAGLAAVLGLFFLKATTSAQIHSTETAERAFVASQRPVLEVSGAVTLSFDHGRGFEVRVPVSNSGGSFARHAAVVSARFVGKLDRDAVKDVCPLGRTYALADRLPSETVYAHATDDIVGPVRLPPADAALIAGIVGSVRYVSDVERVWHCVTFAAPLKAALAQEAFKSRGSAELDAKALALVGVIRGLTLAD